jgi:hypothetical protein
VILFIEKMRKERRGRVIGVNMSLAQRGDQKEHEEREVGGKREQRERRKLEEERREETSFDRGNCNNGEENQLFRERKLSVYDR